MRIKAKIAAVAAASATALVLSASEGAAKYRAHTMEAIGGHMSAIVDIIRGEVPHTDHLPTHANALADTRGARKKARRIVRKKVQHFPSKADQTSAFSGEALIEVV